jgi:CBS domain-containing protein
MTASDRAPTAAVPAAFHFDASPFHCLDAGQRRLVLASIDSLPLAEGQVLLQPDQSPEHLYVLLRGQVQQWDGDELSASYGPDDCFDGRALVAGRASSRFVATQAGEAWCVPKATVNTLIAANATFGALLFADLSNKLLALATHSGQHELQSLTMARVDQLAVRPVQWVEADADVVSVVRLFTAQRVTSVLVRPPPAPAGAGQAATAGEPGIFTTAGLQRAILSGRPLHQMPVGELASRPLVTVRPDAPLYDALATMIQHRVQRLVVVAPAAEDGRAAGGDVAVLGMLEQIDLLSFLSNHSYLITRQIIEAQDLAALQAAAAQTGRVIGLLHRGGTRVALIARLVQALNAKLFERAWQLLAPPDLVANSCLFVMGSEGRGEQLLKTDQDNGLVLRDGYAPPADLAAICQRFSQALASFGYPECPGRIMLSNPQWCMPAAAFGETVRRWLIMPTPDSLMALAIFMDAHAVAGDARLLAQLRGEVFRLATDNDAMLARFAAAISAFDSASGWWQRLLSRDDGATMIDLKKAGTFPLVHGVRSLALAGRITATGTAERVQALVEAGALSPDMGTDLVDSLHFFMGLKLRLGLQSLQAGRQPDSGFRPESLSSLDRDLLKDTLAVVKRFKALLRLRFHLDAL